MSVKKRKRADYQAPGTRRVAEHKPRRPRERGPGRFGFEVRAPAELRPGALSGERIPQGRRPIVRLDDGIIGYGMLPERHDECFRAAIATAMQVAIEQVPDPCLDWRMLVAGDEPQQISADYWTKLIRWLGRDGLQLVFHAKVPVDRERWIGVCKVTVTAAQRERAHELFPDRGDTPFVDHSLVMSRDRILFDPAATVEIPVGMRLREWRPTDVTYGISFDRKE